MITYYVSDPHFLHANIIKLCNRPFGNVQFMDAMLRTEIEACCGLEDTRLVCAGDWTFKIKQFLEWWPEGLPNAADNIMVLGNHDRGYKDAGNVRKMKRFFGTIVGTSEDWRQNQVVVDDWIQPIGTRGRLQRRVLVSHMPQRDFKGCHLNLYGHVHNNLLDPTPENQQYWAENPDKDDRWVLKSEKHINICVEVLDYRPHTLAELIGVHADR